MSVKVSVILTSYNRPKLVGKAIESVLKQTMNDWELIIMDDASNVETKKVIKSYLNDKRIQYFDSKVKDKDRYKTTRYATLINQGIFYSSGKYLSYLTDDTIYLPNRLKLMSAFLETNPEKNIVYSSQRVQFFNEQHELIRERERKASDTLTKAANVVDHCSVMHSRKIADNVFNKFGSYWDDHPDCWHNADAAFWMRLNEFEPFYPLAAVLDQTVKLPNSFQLLNRHLPNMLPNGTVIKGGSNEVFVIDQQKRRKLSDDAFTALKYNQEKIVHVTDPLLFKYAHGSDIDLKTLEDASQLPNQLLVKNKKTGQIYYLENNKKLMVGERAFKAFKFTSSQVITLYNSFLDTIEAGPALALTLDKEVIIPSNIVFKTNSQFYVSNNNRLHSTDPMILRRLNLPINQAVCLINGEERYFKKGTPLVWKFKK